MFVSQSRKVWARAASPVLVLVAAMAVPQSAFAERLSLNSLQAQIQSLQAQIHELSSALDALNTGSQAEVMVTDLGQRGVSHWRENIFRGVAAAPDLDDGYVSWVFGDEYRYRSFPANVYINDQCYLSSYHVDDEIIFYFNTSNYADEGSDYGECNDLRSVFSGQYPEGDVVFYSLP